MVPFFRPSIGEAEIAEVVDSLRSGWLTTGPKTMQFEKDFAEFLGGDLHAVAVNSATAAMHLALEALEIGPGDEVIVPSYTFTATAEVIRYMGAQPVFIDCDLATFNIRPDQVEAAITPRTKAVMPVHFAGLPCDMEGMCSLAKQHGIKVVDDAAHALPAAQNGVSIGTGDADVTAFSFYANKTMTTGEGGMLVTRNPEIAARARTMRLHGISRDVFNRFTDTKASWRYDIVAPGFKYNMTDIAAALGLHQLRRVPEFLDRRTELCARFDAAFADLPLILPASAPSGDQHSRHLYIVRTTDASPVDRDRLIAGLQDRNIGTSVHYTPLHSMSYWRESCGLEKADFPNSEAIGSSCVSLPLFMAMSNEEQDIVIAAVREIMSA
ncbi:DegT/DnrJ/EryC1/StrS family aminotransferase [Altererythrobacter sp. ZODW24]|uniref:DegT/DnrJ/EryC1/StrS family aminotransferase n=1 Tax=Altererythrobacter sp. ZODW24 TaxID=2185142 RepID=UPI000DF77DD0|nr:DegT/DnrJ/EryC1/StrS family aminotransferase [Altererythrobacter sp. ZODW24]